MPLGVPALRAYVMRGRMEGGGTKKNKKKPAGARAFYVVVCAVLCVRIVQSSFSMSARVKVREMM